jgi:hypothetical protein
MELNLVEYTWSFMDVKPHPSIENEFVVVFNYTGTHSSGAAWSWGGVKSVKASNGPEIIEELSNMDEIEVMQIRIQKEIKKILNPENYGLTT